MRDLVIGDVHGAYLALMDALETANYDPASDKLIFLGDYCDRGQQNIEVIQFLRETKAEATRKPVFIRGNHDQMLIDYLSGNWNAGYVQNWVRFNGNTTKAEYDELPEIEVKQHRNFLETMPFFHVDVDNNFVYVHAGWEHSSGVGFEIDSSNYMWTRGFFKDMLRLDNYKLAGMLDSEIRKGGNGKLLRAKNYSRVFVGHSPTINWDQYTPMQAGNVFNLDTGAGYGHKLTIMNAHDPLDYYQSRPVKELYEGFVLSEFNS